MVRSDNRKGEAFALLRFELDDLEGRSISYAWLVMVSVLTTNDQPLLVRIGAANSPWDTTITYETAHGVIIDESGPTMLYRFEPGQKSAKIDVTDLVRYLARADVDNNGLMLDPRGAGKQGNVAYQFASQEWVEGPEPGPQLVVEFADYGAADRRE